MVILVPGEAGTCFPYSWIPGGQCYQQVSSLNTTNIEKPTLQRARPDAPLPGACSAIPTTANTTYRQHRLGSQANMFSCTYAAGLEKETASAWIRSLEVVPMPAHRASRSRCGLGTAGSTRVVDDSRIQASPFAGPVEK